MYHLYYLTSVFDCYQPRYVGYTSCLKRRLLEHINSSKRTESTHKSNWIKQVLKRGEYPIIVEIEKKKSIKSALTAERILIEYYKNWYRLTNSTDGGEKNKKITDSVREKIRNSLKKYYKENKTWNYGLRYSFSEERNKKRRESIGDKISGSNNHFWGKEHKRETREILSKKNRIYNYTYEEVFELYIRQNLTGMEVSEKLGISYICAKKAIKRWGLREIKKKIYGKIKGKKVILNEYDFDQYFDSELF